jgi:hypothetical protein
VFSSIRSLFALAGLLAVAVAIFGYTAGYRRPPAAASTDHRETMHTVSDASVLFEYPTGWRQTSAVAVVPGLSLAHAVLLAPRGDSARAGLLVGQLPGGERTQLPAPLLSLLRGAAHTEVVNLIDGQAFRYSHVGLPGNGGRTLDVYVIPYAGRSPTALVCYASGATASADLAQCERIVAGLTPLGQPSTYDLTPDATYARRLGGLIEGLNGERLRLRREMRTHAAPAAVGRLATALAGRFAATAASLTVLEAPPVAGPTQTALAGSIVRARDAYTTLAATVTAAGAARYRATLAGVDAAEAGVDTALERFALLGYGRS